MNYSLPMLVSKSHPEDALAWLIKAKSSAGTKRIWQIFIFFLFFALIFSSEWISKDWWIEVEIHCIFISLHIQAFSKNLQNDLDQNNEWMQTVVK